MTVGTTMMVIIAKMVIMVRTVTITMTSLILLGKLGKILLFQKIFCWLMLVWFFIFSNADIRFAETKLV